MSAEEVRGMSMLMEAGDLEEFFCLERATAFRGWRTTGSASVTTAGCGCLNVISDLGCSESGRQGSVFRVGAAREGLEDLGQWGGRALLPSTTLEVGWTSSTALRARVLVVSAT